MPLSDLVVAGGSAQTLEGIDFVEKAGSLPVEMGSAITGKRIFYTEWADRIDFARVLRGYITSRGDDSEYIKTAPQAFPGYPLLVCVNARITGIEPFTLDDDDEPQYDVARIDATYAPITVDPDGSTEAEEIIATLDIEFGSEFLAYGSFEYKWSDNDEELAAPQNVGKLIQTIQYTYVQNDLPEIPKAKVFEFIGKVNSGAFDGAPAGQLLFTGASSRKQFDAEGLTRYALTYNFVYRQESWNKFFRTDDGTWSTIYKVKDNVKKTVAAIYASADFAALLTRNLTDGL